MKDKYDGATEVRVNKRGRLQVKNAQYNLPTANDLVYLDESPDYCLHNKTIGSFGKAKTDDNIDDDGDDDDDDHHNDAGKLMEERR